MSQRANQVAEELRKIVSQIFLSELIDSRLGFVTITHVTVTDDLRLARVYYSVLGNDEQKTSTREAIEEHARHIRKLAVEKINMRYAMEFIFEYDKSIEEGFRIEEILKKLDQEKKEGED